ncbi:MAG TPA: DUF488 domain-containing protein [Casimicrobiaceae bacterium]|nr:DUF488 domain-containing protein [Casimicrobiaceae bacterium]
MKLYTIGFTRKSAERFFTMLQRAGVERIVDVRLNNVSQLAGFAKRDDLAWLSKRIAGIEYVHRLDLAPTGAMLENYRRGASAWDDYARAFRSLIAKRRIERTLPRKLVDGACLLCSEHEPDHCHRRIVAEYLSARWGNVEIEHLV